MIRNSNFCALEVTKMCAQDLTRIPKKEEVALITIISSSEYFVTL